MRSEKAERLSQIVETQRDIAAAGLDPERVMALLVERSMALTGADGALVSLLDGSDLVTRAGAGIAAGTVGVRRPLGDSVAAHAIATGQPILVEDAESDPRIDQRMRSKVGDRSLICVPFFDGGRAVGALNVVSSSETDRLGESDRETMEILAVVLSSAVSQATAFELKRQQVEALARFEAMYHGASIGIAMISPEGHVVEANPAMHEILGYSSEEFAERPFFSYTHPDDLDVNSGYFREVMAGERDSYRMEKRYIHKNGDTVWGNVSVSLLRDAAGQPSFAVGMLENITERKLAEDALKRQAELNRHQALHDSLTGLPNRVLFRERIEQALLRASRQDEQVAVLLMDLDRFKEVNDALGHHAGDALLMEVGRRLPAVLRASDTVARLGGDEFGMLLLSPGGAEGVVPLVERIHRALEEPVVVSDLPLEIEASVGVAIYPADGLDSETLLRRADVAMYAAKESNLPYSFFDEATHDQDPTRLTLVAELRRALDERELVLHYQPKAVLDGAAITSVEALVRWNHPQRGMLPPDEFIPLAERTGLIRPLTLYVIEEALRQCDAWRQEGLELSVAVNLSARNLLDFEFPARVEELLARWDVGRGRLELEITESTMLADPARTKLILDRLSGMGIRLSIDDFGTGYSSLAYLKRLPVDEIKIDRSFVMNMANDEDDAVIVRSTIDLGRNLGLEVVAEGVETVEAWDRLKALGCTIAQGYYLSPPVAPEVLSEWLRAKHCAAPSRAVV
jgi:diguanylate cyclase (GGDEF)-like protein/PAS domain S-box-containing protein